MAISVNSKLAGIFEEIGDFLELKGENPFKVKAYQKAARTLQGFSVSVADLEPAEILKTPGIGKAVAEKIAEYLTTGQIRVHEELRGDFPPQILELLEIPGLGAKKASMLYHELKIGSLEELKVALAAGLIATVPGFGAKSEANLTMAISRVQNKDTRSHLGQAAEIVAFFREKLAGLPGVEHFVAAGSFRRRRETVGDIDLICACSESRHIMDEFCNSVAPDEIIARGETKSSLRWQDRIQVDLRVVPRASLGAALQYFTGSKDHNVVLRGRAERMGYKLNEYGLFHNESGESHAGVEEAEIYEKLGLPWIPPELRESGQEIEWADAGQLPVLVEESQILGNLHTHSNWSDGQETLEQLAERARARGYRYLAVTDHSRSLVIANGLSIERLLEQGEEIARLNATFGDGFRLLWGTECDILANGMLDYPDEILERLDFVVVAVHSQMNMSKEDMTARLVRAVSHPLARVLAHPSGRVLGRRAPYEADWEAVFKAAKAHNTAMEINGSPRRQDLSDLMARRAAQVGLRLSLATDAHAPADFDNMGWAVAVARRAGLSVDKILNCETSP